jgi:AcrR family transcriptional regulator
MELTRASWLRELPGKASSGRLTDQLVNRNEAGGTVPAPRKLTDDHLLGKAAELFARRGYDGTAIPDLLAELGVSRPTLYAHTRSKRSLIEGIYRKVVAYYQELLPRMLRAEDPPAIRLRQLVAVQIQATGDLGDCLVVALNALPELAEEPTLRAWWRELDDTLREILVQARQDGTMPAGLDLTVARRAIWAVLNDLPRWYRQGALSPEMLTDQLVLLFTGGFAGDPGPHG